MNETIYSIPAQTMTLPKPSRLHTFLHTLPCRIGLVVLTSVATACILPLLFVVNQLLSPVLLRIFAIIILGLISGFAARRLLVHHTTLLKLLSAWLGVIGGMVVSHEISAGFIGFRLLPPLANHPNWSGLAQLLLSMLAAWLAVYAWKGTHRASPPTSSVHSSSRVTAPRRVERSPKTKSAKARSRYSRKPALLTPKYWHSKKKSLTKNLTRWQDRAAKSFEARQHKANLVIDRVRQRLNVHPGSTNGKIRLRHPKNASITHKNTHDRHVPIKLVGKQENRCPYCLELVQTNDSRGIKICPVCHTYHHKDCWQAGNGCQVPHIHE